MLLTSDNLVEQALDPSQVDIPPESLWTVFGTMFGFTLGGLFILWLVIRKFGKPGGELDRRDLLVALPVFVGVFFGTALFIWPISQESPLFGGIGQSLMALLAIVFVGMHPWRPDDNRRAEWLTVKPVKLAFAPLAWVLAVPVLITAMFAAVALAQLTDLPVTMQGPVEQLRSRNDTLWIIGWYVMAGLAAPLMEEFVFRVVLFGGILGLMKPVSDAQGWKHPGTWVALLFSGALFVLAHGVWEWTVGIIPLSALTFVLTAVYLHTRSIWPSVLVHAIHNSFVVTMQFFVLM